MARRVVLGQTSLGFGAKRARIAVKPAAWCALVIVLGVAADIATKTWAKSRLANGRHITLVGGRIRLQLVINHGASFGLGAGYEPIIALVTFAGMILLGTWAFRAASKAERLGAALAAAGAAGNLIDRLTQPPAVLHGGVVDWLHVWFYGPTFNLADIWLRGGLLIAAVGWLWKRRASASSPPTGTATSPPTE